MKLAQHLARVTDPAFRSRVEVAVLATESDLKRRTDPAAAVDAADAGDSTRSATGRSAAHRAAEPAVGAGKHRAGDGPSRRASRSTGASSVHRRARGKHRTAADLGARRIMAVVRRRRFSLSLKEKNYERAFALAEARACADPRVNRRNSALSSLAAVQSALAPDEAILALNQFDDELAVWVIQLARRRRHDAPNVSPDIAATDRAPAARDLELRPRRRQPAAIYITRSSGRSRSNWPASRAWSSCPTTHSGMCRSRRCTTRRVADS